MAEAAGRHRRGRRGAARDLDRQGRHRGAVAGDRRPRGDPRPGGRDGRGRDEARDDRAARAPTWPRRPPRRRRPSPRPRRRRPRRTRRRRPRPSSRRRRSRSSPPSRSLRPPQPRRSGGASGNGKTFVSPVVARIASEHGVDPSQVPGTGRGGRVTKKDILGFIESGAARAAGSAPEARRAAARAGRRRPGGSRARAAAGPGSRSCARSGEAAPAPVAAAEAQAGETVEPMTAMRRGHRRAHAALARHLGARHLARSRSTCRRSSPIREKLKKEYQAAYGVNPTYLAFIARATVETLQRLPVDQRRAARRPDRHAQLRQPRLRGRARRRQGPDRPGGQERRDAQPARDREGRHRHRQARARQAAAPGRRRRAARSRSRTPAATAPSTARR